MRQLKRLAQVAIVCRDIEVSRQRWAEALGVDAPAVIVTEPGLACATRYRGAPSDARAKLAFFELENVQIELIEPMEGPSAWQDGLDRNGESVHHLGFWVEDVEQAKAELAQSGEVVHDGTFGGGNGSYHYIDSQDRLGVMLELLHRKGAGPK